MATGNNLAEVLAESKKKGGDGKEERTSCSFIPSVKEQIAILTERGWPLAMGMGKQEFTRLCVKAGVERENLLIIPNLPIGRLPQIRGVVFHCETKRLQHVWGHEVRHLIYGLLGFDFGLLDIGKPVNLLTARNGCIPRPTTLVQIIAILMYNQNHELPPAKYFGAGGTFNGGQNLAPVVSSQDGTISVECCICSTDHNKGVIWPNFERMVLTAT